MYVLILTIILAGDFPGRSPVAASVAQVQGFNNKEQCLIAANAWLERQREVRTTASRERYDAVCAKL